MSNLSAILRDFLLRSVELLHGLITIFTQPSRFFWNIE